MYKSDINMIKQLRSILVNCIPLVMGISIFEALDLQNLGTRIIAVLMYIVVYLFFNAIIKNEGFVYIVQTIKELKSSFKNQLVHK